MKTPIKLFFVLSAILGALLGIAGLSFVSDAGEILGGLSESESERDLVAALTSTVAVVKRLSAYLVGIAVLQMLLMVFGGIKKTSSESPDPCSLQGD